MAHQLAEALMQLRSPACEIHQLRLEPFHGVEALLHHRLRHLGVGLIRTSIHMAVAAAHVAQPAEVELQHLQAALALERDAKAVLSRQVGLQQRALLLGA